ncbi:MAG TPA: hypothetical protein VMN36_07400 [Verrucomicrobiales bacterium]|nr:hypothetical protein [Verrucomicrobiales bacterium]
MRIILFLALSLSFFASVEAGFRAGIAVKVVTPDPLLSVSGGIGPSHPVSRKLGDLTVRALVFEQGEVRVALASADFLGFPSVLGDRVRERVRSSVPGDHILIGATHTHSAPDMYGFPDGQGGTSADLGYMDQVCSAMAEAIEEAVAGLVPARVRIASGEAKGKIAYNYYAPDLYDRRCGVIQVVSENGGAIATLVNYAIHPEVLGPNQGILSPDLIGPLCDRLAGRGGGVGIFMNGAQGGMITADVRGPDGEDVQTWEECVRIGNLLADEALRLVAASPVQEDPVLRCRAERFAFPIDSEAIRGVLAASPLKFPRDPDGTLSTTVNFVRLGNARILTIPGEALPNIGFYLKRKMPGDHAFLFGLTNDAFGYLLTRVDWNSFERYAYVSRVCLGEMTGEIFIEGALRMMEESGE